MPSNRQPSIVAPGPGKLAAGQVPASALSFPVGDTELSGKELALDTRTVVATAGGGGVPSIVLPIGTFVGDVVSYPLDRLFEVVDQAGRAILNAGTRVAVASISGATVGSLFTVATVTINLTPSIPAGIQYQVYYQTRSTLASLPIDALTFSPDSNTSAASVSYGGSANWADATAVTATTVEAAIDEVVSDLASASGAAKIGATISATWADATGIAATTIDGALEEIVTDLTSTTASADGGGRVGINATGTNWADASGIVATNVTNAVKEIVTDLAGATGAAKIGATVSATWRDTTGIAATTVDGALEEIVSELADATNGSSGARKIGYSSTGSLWAGGGTLAATSVEEAIDEVVATLGLTTNGSSGASKVGYSGSTSPWKDGTTLAAGQVEAAVDEIVTTLAGVATGTGSGASKIGVYATDFSNVLTGTGGGGILTASTQLKAALTDINAALVARRGFTAVVTSGTTSVGGDLNGTTPFTGMNALASGGTFFFRRGGYLVNNAQVGDSDYILVGESGSGSTSLANSGAGTVTFSRSSNIGLVSFEHFKFIHSSGPYGYFQFGDGTLRMRHCQFTAGALEFLPQTLGLRLQVEGLHVLDNDVLIERDASILFASQTTKEATGVVQGLRVSHVPSWNNATQAKYAMHHASFVPTAVQTIDSLTFENANLNITTGFAAGNGAVFRSENSTAPVTFNGCLFRQGVTTSAAGVLEISGSSNLTFNDCTFVQSGIGKVLSIVGAATNNIKFKNCRFYTSDLVALSQEFHVACGSVDAPPVVFENCTVYLRKFSDSVTYRMEFNSLNGGDLAAANGSISVDGLKVILDFTGQSISPRMFYVNSHTTSSFGSVLSFKNLSFYLNSNRLKVASQYAIQFFTNGAPSFVENLQIHGIREPMTPATTNTCDLVYLNGSHVTGGACYDDSAGAGELAWHSLFELTGGATLTKFIFHANNSTVVRGRCTHIIGDGCVVSKCKAVVTNLNASEDTTGWFCLIDSNKHSCSVLDNRISISSGIGALNGSSMAVVRVGSGSTEAHGHHKILDNSFSVNGEVFFINSDASYTKVSDNTFDQVTGNSINAIFLSGDYNTVFGNITHNRSVNTASVAYNGGTNANSKPATLSSYNSMS